VKSKPVEYSTSATIGASPDRVWKILTDAAGYRDWNPEIIAVDGEFGSGSAVAHVRLGDGAVRKVAQRVSLEAPMRMQWLSGLPLGLFVGRRTFTVNPVAGGSEFRMHLHMSGLLCSLILKSVGNRQPEIDKFASALKRRAEAA